MFRNLDEGKARSEPGGLVTEPVHRTFTVLPQYLKLHTASTQVSTQSLSLGNATRKPVFSVCKAGAYYCGVGILAGPEGLDPELKAIFMAHPPYLTFNHILSKSVKQELFTYF